MTALVDPVVGRHRRAEGVPPNLGRLGTAFTLVGVVLMCFTGHWDDLGIPLPLDRPFLIVGVGLSVFDFIKTGGRFFLRPVHVLLVVGSLLAILSALASNATTDSDIYSLLDRYGIVPFALLLFAPAIFPDERSRRLFARVFVIFGLYLSVTAITQQTGIDFMVWPRYILEPSVGAHFDRARGPYAEAVANGLMLAAAAALASTELRGGSSRVWRLLASICVPLCVVGTVLTLTRAIWLATALAIVVCVAAIPALRRRGAVVALSLGAAVGLAFLLVPSLDEAISQRAGDENPVWDRLNTNAAALRMALANPLFGVGWGQSGDRMAEYVRHGADYPVTAVSAFLEPHNLYLLRLAELGVLGGTLWLASVLTGVIHPILRRPDSSKLQVWRAALLAIAVTWLVAGMFSPMAYTQPNAILWMTGGIVLGPYLGRGYHPDAEGARGRVVR